MLTLAERAALGGQATARHWQARKERFLAAVRAGQGVKHAAHAADVSERSARRYRAEAAERELGIRGYDASGAPF